MSKSSKKLTNALLMVAILCAACAESTASLPYPTQQATLSQKYIPFAVIEQSAPLGDGPAEPFYALVTAGEDWDSLTSHLPAALIISTQAALKTSNTLYLLAFAGVRGSSGYAIDITAIYQQDERYIVIVTETTPSPQTIIEPAKTLPYVLVSVPLAELPQGQTLSFVFTNPQGTILEQGETQLP